MVSCAVVDTVVRIVSEKRNKNMRAKSLPSLKTITTIYHYDPVSGIFRHKRGYLKGKLAGYVEKSGRLRLSIKNKNYLANRVAYFLTHGWCPDVVDHKDRDVTNNAITNLRAASYTQNNWNSAGHSDKKSNLPKGIRLTKNRQRFRAIIQINGLRFSVGTYASLEEAISARNLVAHSNHGEFYVKET